MMNNLEMSMSFCHGHFVIDMTFCHGHFVMDKYIKFYT